VGDSNTLQLAKHPSGLSDPVFIGLGGEGLAAIAPAAVGAARLKPEKMFVMVGTNDVILERMRNFLEAYEKMISDIQRASPQTRIYVQSILPVNCVNFPRIQQTADNANFTVANNALASLAARLGAVYVDVAGPLTDGQGNLNKRFTDDGVHLNTSGVFVWKDILSKQ
jgi:lysophospholipase L1-like esterase